MLKCFLQFVVENFICFYFDKTFLIINRFNHTVVTSHRYFTLAWLFWVSQLDWLFYIYVNNCNFDQLQIVFFLIHITTFCIIDILISSVFQKISITFMQDWSLQLFIHTFIYIVCYQCYCLSSIACYIIVQNETTIVR